MPCAQSAQGRGTCPPPCVPSAPGSFPNKVPGVTGVRMPLGMDPQSPYGQVLTNQQAPSWRARELWRRDAEEAGLASRDTASLLQHHTRMHPDLSPAIMQVLREALNQQLQ